MQQTIGTAPSAPIEPVSAPDCSGPAVATPRCLEQPSSRANFLFAHDLFTKDGAAQPACRMKSGLRGKMR
ncbi:hypothetical protein [Bradyrhizobium sp.]|uniref:hypothetical protein n=1 Tax=Bradyrhizobium sp. TaxID=376 RepID=UPI003C40037F